MVEQNELTPSEYFDFVKGRKQTVTDEDLSKVYDNCLDLLNKYKVTGQIKGMKKLIFHLQCIEAEREIVKMGITTFIYRDDIEEYIDNVASDTVKIIELQNYEREIPDEIVDNGLKAKRGFKPGSSFNVIWGKGGPPSATLKAQNERRRRDNINAGKRGAAEWRERMPKLMK